MVQRLREYNEYDAQVIALQKIASISGIVVEEVNYRGKPEKKRVDDWWFSAGYFGGNHEFNFRRTSRKYCQTGNGALRAYAFWVKDIIKKALTYVGVFLLDANIQN